MKQYGYKLNLALRRRAGLEPVANKSPPNWTRFGRCVSSFYNPEEDNFLYMMLAIKVTPKASSAQFWYELEQKTFFSIYFEILLLLILQVSKDVLIVIIVLTKKTFCLHSIYSTY